MRAPYINPMIKVSCRTSQVYATIMADLVDAEVLTLEQAEKIAGYKLFPSKKKQSIIEPAADEPATELDEDEEDVDTESGDTESGDIEPDEA